MTNKLTEFAEKFGMKQDGKNHYYGIVKGYETNLCMNIMQFSKNSYPIQMHISCHLNDEAKKDLLKVASTSAIKTFKIDFTAYGLWIGINGSFVGPLLKTFEPILEQIFDVLTQHSILGADYCPLCGEPLNSENQEKITVYNHTITLNKECASRVTQFVAKEKARYQAAPNNIKKGIWGALIGAIVSVVATVILFLLNFISGWCSVIGIILGTFLYKKFGGKANGAMIAICFAFTLIFQLLAVFLLHVSAASGLAINNELSYRGFEAFKYYMSSKEPLAEGSNATFASVFTSNMVSTAIFSIVGCGLSSIDVLRKAKAERGF